MQIVKFYTTVLNSIQEFMTFFENKSDKLNKKAGRKPKLTDYEIASLFVLSYIYRYACNKISKTDNR
jgi:hypothetical protein